MRPTCLLSTALAMLVGAAARFTCPLLVFNSSINGCTSCALTGVALMGAYAASIEKLSPGPRLIGVMFEGCTPSKVSVKVVEPKRLGNCEITAVPLPS